MLFDAKKVRSPHFYPRSPRGERLECAIIGFCFLNNFYPRSPRGERRKLSYALYGREEFLSTLPARGATQISRERGQVENHFYPRSPRGERHAGLDFVGCEIDISIHAPREGSDLLAQTNA